MNYKKLLSILFLLTAIVLATQAGTRNWIDFNDSWKFIKGNPENAQAINFDDSSWETVNLPHDWAIKGPFNIDEPGNTGQLPWKGEGWYRKVFQVDFSIKVKLSTFCLMESWHNPEFTSTENWLGNGTMATIRSMLM